MKITEYSRIRMMETAEYWRVPRDYFDPLYNYLIYGFAPGGFWAAVLANNFMAAMQSSHPGNSIPDLKNTVGWIQDSFPAISYGSYQLVDAWIHNTTPLQRRSQLEAVGLIYPEREEILKGLRGETATEPHLW
jgi:hypothetical protein